MAFMPPMPGYPGPAFAGRTSMIPPVAFPRVPGQPAGAVTCPAAPAQGGSPFEAMARAGVPITVAPDGRPILKTGAGGAGGGFGLPPEIPGMPQMPSPPDWLINQFRPPQES